MKKILALLVAGTFMTSAFAMETSSAPVSNHKATASKTHKKAHKTKASGVKHSTKQTHKTEASSAK